MAVVKLDILANNEEYNLFSFFFSCVLTFFIRCNNIKKSYNIT
jgi:hypothetical protein